MMTVLLIEDDDTLRMGISQVLKKNQFKVFEAASGPKGVDLFRRYRQDIVITDFRMEHVYLLRGHGSPVAIDRPADVVDRRPRLRPPLCRHPVRHRLLQPPDRCLHRSLARWPRLRRDRQLPARMVGRRRARRIRCPGQPPDRRSQTRRRGARFSLTPGQPLSL